MSDPACNDPTCSYRAEIELGEYVHRSEVERLTKSYVEEFDRAEAAEAEIERLREVHLARLRTIGQRLSLAGYNRKEVAAFLADQERDYRDYKDGVHPPAFPESADQERER